MNTNVTMTNFTKLFKQITPEEIPDDVFTLVGKVFPVITAGNQDHYNSMIASGGGMGVHFKKPATWCIIQANRYTLELIKKEQAYTLSYFSDEYKSQVLFLGNHSGRNSSKMNTVNLTSAETPDGNISFKEARLIIECSLTQITPANLDDFYSQEAKDFLSVVYQDAAELRKYVFGEITHVWVKKDEEELK